MSLARQGDNCDVYVFFNDEGLLECLSLCHKYQARYVSELTRHLKEEHIDKGDKVPAYLYDELNNIKQIFGDDLTNPALQKAIEVGEDW